MLFEAVFRARLELVQIPARLCHPDHRHIEVPSFHHGLQGREDFLVGEVAGRTEKNQSVRSDCGHVSFLSNLGY